MAIGLPSHSVTIGGFEYEFTVLPVESGHPLRWELIALLGEPLLQAGAAATMGKGWEDLDVPKVLGELSRLFSRLEPAFVLKLQKVFIGVTKYRGPGGEWTPLERTWMLHFAARYHELDALTWAHLRVNYLGFLDDSAVWQEFLRVGRQVWSAAQSLTTSRSTGTSGASSVAAS